MSGATEGSDLKPYDALENIKKIIGRSDAGATFPHGRVGLTLKLKDSFANRPTKEAEQ